MPIYFLIVPQCLNWQNTGVFAFYVRCMDLLIFSEKARMNIKTLNWRSV